MVFERVISDAEDISDHLKGSRGKRQSPRINDLRNASTTKPIGLPNKQSTLFPGDMASTPGQIALGRIRIEYPIREIAPLNTSKPVLMIRLEWTGVTLMRSDFRLEIAKPLGRT
jgi:hypothetical protein